jgi:hypothetical protein
MKGPAEITGVVQRRLERTWHLDAAGGGDNWPYTIALGSLTAEQLSADFSATRQQVQNLREWAGENGLIVTDTNRRVHGTTQPMPTHVTVADVDIAARLAGAGWVGRVGRGRTRGELLADRYPGCGTIAKVVRSVDTWSDVDFELLQTVADWFASNTATGLTPRQVPVPGVHAKWLNTGRPVVELLVGKPLELAERHPPRVHFTYLTPAHLVAGGRRFDSATVGDTDSIAYRPQIVIISENKDTAVNFPPLDGAVAVEGNGFGGSTAAQFDWVTAAPVVIYWGDIDADGFEILDGYRNGGIPALSVLMDLETLRSYGAFGTDLDKNGRIIEKREPRALTRLTDDERAAYEAVCSGREGLPLRLEQERIPLEQARALISQTAERVLKGAPRPLRLQAP